LWREEEREENEGGEGRKPFGAIFSPDRSGEGKKGEKRRKG